MNALIRHTVRASDGASFELTTAGESASAGGVGVLCLPAMGIESRYYDRLVLALAAAGSPAASMDLRGMGSSSIRASRRANFGYAEMVERDLPAALDTLERLWRSRRIVVLGHSLGGQLGAMLAAAQPGRLAGLALVAAGMPYYRCWQRGRLRVALGTQLAWAFAVGYGYFPGKTLGFGGREARGVMRDWAHSARTGRYRLANADYDYEQALRSVTLPVLAIGLNSDDLSPPRAIDHLLAKMPRAQVERWQYVPEGGGRVDHNRWPRDPAAIVSRVTSWLRNAN